MDPFNMAYYALVCCCLAGASGRINGWLTRIVTGGVVGLVAAALLPVLRGALGLN